MQESKSVFKSKAVWGAIVATVAAIAGAFGINVDTAEQAELVNICVAVAVAVGGAVSVYGRIKADKPVHVVKPKAKAMGKALGVLLALLLPVALSACALTNLAPHEKGLAVGDELRASYTALYSEYLELHEALPPDGVAFLEEKVAPVMDSAKAAIIAYRDAAQVYARTRVEPGAWVSLFDDAKQALASCAALVVEARAYLKEVKS